MIIVINASQSYLRETKTSAKLHNTNCACSIDSTWLIASSVIDCYIGSQQPDTSLSIISFATGCCNQFIMSPHQHSGAFSRCGGRIRRVGLRGAPNSQSIRRRIYSIRFQKTKTQRTGASPEGFRGNNPSLADMSRTSESQFPRVGYLRTITCFRLQ